MQTKSDERLQELRFSLKYAKKAELDKYIDQKLMRPLVNYIFKKARLKRFSRQRKETLEFILCNLIASRGTISLSLNERFYRKLPKRYNPRKITGGSIREMVSILKTLQYVEYFKGFNYAQKSCISRLMAEPSLMRLIDRFELKEKHLKRHPDAETIYLKDENKKLIDYEDSRVRKERDFLEKYNNFLSKTELSLRTRDQSYFRESMQLKRIFNKSIFELGGRFYSDFQNLRKEQRKHLRIDGEPTVELDYSGIHINMLYIKETGKPFGEEDVYAVRGFKRQRKFMKVLLQIALNSRDRKTGNQAFRFHCMEKRVKIDYKKAIKLFDKKHELISKYFYSEIGLHLQYLDALIAEDVMKECMNKGVIALPVHDSFITQKRHEKFLQKTMYESSKKVLGHGLEAKE